MSDKAENELSRNSNLKSPTVLKSTEKLKQICQWLEDVTSESFQDAILGSPDPFGIWNILGGKPKENRRLWERAGKVLANELKLHSPTIVSEKQEVMVHRTTVKIMKRGSQ